MARRLPRAVNVAIGEILVSRPVTRFNRWLLRRSGGRFGGGGLGMDVILVTTRGRRSGEPRSVPLGAVRDGATWVVIASNAGHDKMPAWAMNLRAGPAVTVEHRGVAAPYRAHEARGDEADRLWPIVIDAYGGYADYRTRTERPIALFVLEPA
jgi:deazaflavin-dependent oxidoreductase (nitroreductase family)